MSNRVCNSFVLSRSYGAFKFRFVHYPRLPPGATNISLLRSMTRGGDVLVRHYAFKNPNSYTIGCNFSVNDLYADSNAAKLTGAKSPLALRACRALRI